MATPEQTTGKITADPNPIPAENDSTTVLRWESGAERTEVCVCEEGGPEKLVSCGSNESLPIAWIQGGRDYLFRLYDAQEPRRLLDEIRVVKKVVGKVTASPNPIPIEAGSKTTLQWEITAPASAEIYITEDGINETLVCRGQSGSYEISALRSGVDYRIRLYAHSRSRPLLDEIQVRLKDIPWSLLLNRLETAHAGEEFSDEVLQILGGILSRCVRHSDFPRWFRLWEESGVHVTPVHFYEPIPDLRSLSEKLWEQPQALPGIEMNDAMQLRLLCEVFPKFKEEYEKIPLDAPAEGKPFYLRNGRFEGLDPMLAYCLVRHYQPRQIIEVGSGYSTLLLAQAASANDDTELHSIEPYPEEFLRAGFPGLTSLLVKKVEEVDLSFFQRLSDGDCLFIDTSHVVRIGGDVNHLFLEVLPRLNPGVIVHVHDIFLPFEYPRDWVMERRRFWTEQYLLQAFLAFNSDFEVLVSSGYLKARHLSELKTVFPNCAPWQGGSFWMRRKS